MRTCRGVLVVLAMAVGLVSLSTDTAARASSDGSAEDAAREITEAREAANAAADEFWAAEDQLQEVSDEKARLDAATAELQEQVDKLQKAVETLVVNRYIGSGTTGIDLLSGSIGPTEQAQTEVLVGIIDEVSAV